MAVARESDSVTVREFVRNIGKTFDDVPEQGGVLITREGRPYVALLRLNPTREVATPTSEHADHDPPARGPRPSASPEDTGSVDPPDQSDDHPVKPHEATPPQSGHPHGPDDSTTSASGPSSGSHHANPTAEPRESPPKRPVMHDVFVSYAREDKAFARAVASALRDRGRTVWIDEQELVLGDSLRRQLSDGLAHARIGVVVLSPDFFRKTWTKWELDGLTARLMAGEQNVVVPIWHAVNADDVRRFSPPLADLVSIDSAEGVASVADAIGRTLERIAPRPDELPDTVELVDLLNLRTATVVDIHARWRSSSTAVMGLPVTIGNGSRGRASVDFLNEGPNSLIVGAAGVGKTEFLRTAILCLATNHAPGAVRVIAIDYTNSLGLRQLEDLPQELIPVTDLDSSTLEALLNELRSDFVERERVLRTHLGSPGEFSLASFVPTLIIMDEFTLVAQQFPGFVGEVVDIAQRGRGLGFATMLATQTDRIPGLLWANAAIRVAFRTSERDLSQSAVGSPDAVGLKRVGRAYLRCGAIGPECFQAAFCPPTATTRLVSLLKSAGKSY